jgi:hypothetical protein
MNFPQMMNSAQILEGLERERRLLEDFITLSEEQLMLLESDNIEAVQPLLQERADLMLELTAIDATLGTWILQIRTDTFVSLDVVRELRAVNDEIVSMANHIVDIDEQIQARLDLIKQNASYKMVSLDAAR